MKRVFCGFYFLFVFLVSGYCAEVCDCTTANRYAILFGWETEGSHELLARQATAFGRFRDTRSLAISFGNLLGPSLIVRHDTADQFLEAAHKAGFDYIIPSSQEFMFGAETAGRFAENDRYPRFISANVVDKKTKMPIFDPYAAWYVSGLRICIVAISDTSIMRDAPREGVAGIEVISCDEALTAVSAAVARERADIVIVAGRMDRNVILETARRHPFVDIFLTNCQSGGFSEAGRITSTAVVLGKPVYIGPEAGNQLGLFAVRSLDGAEAKEFTTLTLGDAFPPDKDILASLTSTLDEFKKRETEEAAIVNTGSAVASVLRRVFGADVVFLHRESLFYYPLKDSLTIFNIRNVVKPYEKLTRYEVKGSVLKAVLGDMESRPYPGDRLIVAGLTADGKVDTIPVADDRAYTVLTTTHLRSGGNGYVQFRSGTNGTLTDINMLAAVENYLVEKDDRLRKLARKKPWTLVLNMKIGANLNKVDVDRDKILYKNIPDPFKSMTDQFMGFFSFASNGNTFAYQRKRHLFTSMLDMSYIRTGSRISSSKVIYGKLNDLLRLTSKYVYNVPTFSSVPYVDLTITSALHPGPGKHPIRADMSTGLTRKLPKYWVEVSLGMNGSRDYITNRNNLGSKTEVTINKVFPAHSFLTSQTQLSSVTRVFWWPSAQFHSMFRHENENSLSMVLWKKFELNFQVKSYTYRDNTIDKVASGFQYFIILNYSMQRKI